MEINYRDFGNLIVQIIQLLTIIMLIKKRRKLKPYGDYMTMAMILTLVIDLSCFYIRKSPMVSNVYIVDLYYYGVLFMFFFIVLYMYTILVERHWIKVATKTIVAVFLVFFAVYTTYFRDDPGVLPWQLVMFNAILLVMSIGLFFIDTFHSEVIIQIKHYYPFWFSLGLMVIYVAMIPPVIIYETSDVKMSGHVHILVVFFINLIGYGIIYLGTFYSKRINK